MRWPLHIPLLLTIGWSCALARDPEMVREGPWFLEWKSAQREALQAARPIVMVFTDSQAGGENARLDIAVFRSPVFLDWASREAVLMRVDQPRALHREPAQRRESERLRTRYMRYRLDPGPVVLVVSATGAVVGDSPFAWPDDADAATFTNALKAFVAAGGPEGAPPEEPEGEAEKEADR